MQVLKGDLAEAMDSDNGLASHIVGASESSRLRTLQPLQVQREHALTAQRSGNLAGRSGAQLLGSRHFDLWLWTFILPATQPTAEPVVGGEAAPLVVPMSIVRLEHPHLLFCADRGVDLGSFGKRLARAGDREKITNSGEHEIGFGGESVQIIGVVDSILQPPGENLLCVLRTNCAKHQIPGSDVAGRGSDLDAIVERREIGGVGAAP